jgi:hypothetical protein
VEQATQARGVIDGVIISASRGGVRRSTGIDGGASSEQTSMVVLEGARGGAQRRSARRSSSGASLEQFSTEVEQGAESGGAGDASSRCHRRGDSRCEQGWSQAEHGHRRQGKLRADIDGGAQRRAGRCSEAKCKAELKRGELGAVLDRWSRGRSRAEQVTQARSVIDGVTLGASRGGVRRSTGISDGARSEQTSMGRAGGKLGADLDGQSAGRCSEAKCKAEFKGASLEQFSTGGAGGGVGRSRRHKLEVSSTG